MDDGRVTDSQGRVVNFNNTVLIMTSNIGSQYITGGLDASLGSPDAVYEAMRERVLDAARLHFRPEFMNRVDEYIVFQQLAPNQIEAIVRLQLDRVRQRVADRKIKIEVTESAIKLLGVMGYDPAYGARPVKVSSPLLLERQCGQKTIPLIPD